MVQNTTKGRLSNFLNERSLLPHRQYYDHIPEKPVTTVDVLLHLPHALHSSVPSVPHRRCSLTWAETWLPMIFFCPNFIEMKMLRSGSHRGTGFATIVTSSLD